MIDKITPGWLAGFFDGEGCVSIGNNCGCINIHVSITQSNLLILEAIASKFGGGPYVQDKRYRKIAYSLQWGGKASQRVLEYIKDHVIIKKDRVDLALEFLSGVGKTGQRVTGSENTRRKELGAKIRQLNDAVPRTVASRARTKRLNLENEARKLNRPGDFPSEKENVQ
jgi:LAGLIDADG DNA endonuclease family protein